MESIEYSGTVYDLDHKYPEPLIKHSLKKLQQLGIKKEDKDFYVGINNPIDVRRNTLECSRELIQNLQSYENVKKVRERFRFLNDRDSFKM